MIYHAKQIAVHDLPHWLLQSCLAADEPTCWTTQELAACFLPRTQTQELPAIKRLPKLSSTETALELKKPFPYLRAFNSLLHLISYSTC